MSTKFPPFRVTIVGDTAEEVRQRMLEYLGDRTTVPDNSKRYEIPTLTDDQDDFVTEAAARSPIGFERGQILPTFLTEQKSASEMASHSSPGVNDYGVDSCGLPWDERIHSTTQGKNKDGSWRTKRGVEDDTVRRVESELADKARAMQAHDMVTASPAHAPGHPPAAAAPTTSAPALYSVPSVAPIAPPVAAQPISPAAPIPPPEPVLPAAHTVATFKALLIPTLAKLVRDGKLNHEYIGTLQNHFGVDMLHKVNDQQLEELFNSFVHYGMIVKA